jgi:hypothetical protein
VPVIKWVSSDIPGVSSFVYNRRFVRFHLQSKVTHRIRHANFLANRILAQMKWNLSDGGKEKREMREGSLVNRGYEIQREGFCWTCRMRGCDDSEGTHE